LVLFPNCKINLGLKVIGKRPDGYHNLETVFYPLPLKDAIEILHSKPNKASGSEFDLTLLGQPVPGELSSNLCYKAWQLIKNDHPHIPSLKMHLLKAIPVGAGLGGGSSNGAFTLKMLNDEFNLNLSQEKLIEYALRLGSDCPFFIINKPCFATGRGEEMEQIDVGLSDHYFILADLGIHINTAWAFSKWKGRGENADNSSLKEIISRPVTSWKNKLVNDFEEPVFNEYPALARIRESLYDAGAEYASMTGTGSCIYGIFRRNNKAEKLRTDGSYVLYNLNQQP
jgi:4-diphosphocytidyl-2-C-methyl-D-erythritol kinase